MSDKTASKETEKDEDDKPEEKKTLSLGGGTLSLGSAASAKAKQSLGGNGVAVEIRRSRRKTAPAPAPAPKNDMTNKTGSDGLTADERDARIKALQKAIEDEKSRSVEEAKKPKPSVPAGGSVQTKEDLRKKELEELQRIEAQEAARAEQEQKKRAEQADKFKNDTSGRQEEDSESYRDRMKKAPTRARSTGDRRNSGKLTVTQVLNNDYERNRSQSLAALKRARAKAKAAQGPKEPAAKVAREVVVPEMITVQELANRMTEKSGDVIKALMNMGTMATINQMIDADTAELIIDEFGHKIKRVTEADVEIGLGGEDEDRDEDMVARPPVVTIMGHVDHGKTSLLDAFRSTDVVAGEAGGITQHIGAYQIKSSTGQKITFLDTPGHAAFTEMRARGANVTDIVVIVVAANDSIMPQTIEAINHAKAAKVPLIVAINKIDLPDANPMKVKQDLLQHEVVIEEMGGEVLCVEVSAKQRTNLDKLEEIILLQAELLDIKANPNRQAQGNVVEAKLEQGRGSVATVLITKGTLNKGDIFVAGSEWGRVRALINDKGKQIKEAIPGQPVEVLGLNGTPEAGDSFVVVDNEAKAREVVDYRNRKKLEKKSALAGAGSSLELLMAQAKEEGSRTTMPIVIKGDVHGSVEALLSSLKKIEEENPDIAVQALHTGVGGITESDVTLANASGALIVGFNVRANAQARDLAKRDGVDIRYYNIIYNVIDDVKSILAGMLSPLEREEYLGQAEIREVFNVSKVGKVAGCMVTAGEVKRGSHVRLLRDDVVIHEGRLKTLKRFKDEVKEVREGMECGMAFESYDDIKEGDIIECFEVKEEARTLD
ncbi:MAG: translation initiation factor IF-2 [Micavibrio sp.]|nr:translation initiation factor IF-2 [Micavibrio sp.]|tara:strand:- start:237008 stop:239500 length:2493 start_codon:yes stop_codon:yes gene_type:complete